MEKNTKESRSPSIYRGWAEVNKRQSGVMMDGDGITENETDRQGSSTAATPHLVQPACLLVLRWSWTGQRHGIRIQGV
jgi:hypothetical protein